MSTMTSFEKSVLEIDGSQGEGGGQILRTALALSLRLGTPFRLSNVRQNRAKPGLRPQHLAAVMAAARLGAAAVEGAAVGSQTLSFSPQLYGAEVPCGHYKFDIGTAGSAPLVLQTVLPALLGATGPSRVTIIGGTYNTKAPPVDYLCRVFAPLLARLGAGLRVHCERPGFYPVGGGQIVAEIAPCATLAHLDLRECGSVKKRRATVVLSRLPEHIAEREVAMLIHKLGWPMHSYLVRRYDERDSRSSGNVILLEIESEHITELFSYVGERGLPAEQVASQAADEALAYLDAEVPVGEHLADQLILPLALSRGGVYRTTPPSLHTLTQLAVVRRFLPDVEITIVNESEKVARIEVKANLSPKPQTA